MKNERRKRKNRMFSMISTVDICRMYYFFSKYSRLFANRIPTHGDEITTRQIVFIKSPSHKSHNRHFCFFRHHNTSDVTAPWICLPAIRFRAGNLPDHLSCSYLNFDRATCSMASSREMLFISIIG